MFEPIDLYSGAILLFAGAVPPNGWTQIDCWKMWPDRYIEYAERYPEWRKRWDEFHEMTKSGSICIIQEKYLEMLR